MQKTQKLGIGLILSLVLLRLVIGMHFFREGLNKLRDPKPFSANFFSSPHGPFAASYQNLVWDRDGLARLDIEGTVRAWDQFRAQLERHYGFDAAQKKRAANVLGRYESLLKDYAKERADDIREYRGNIERRDRYRQDPARMETPSLRGQVEKIEAELRTKRSGLVGPIDAMWQGYARDLNALATRDQRSRGELTLSKPARRLIDTERIDAWIPWFDTIIGVLLIVGFLTRPAALLGAAFLLSVVTTQWPTDPSAVPTWPQAIEALGLLVVAAAGAGRYAGLDSLLPAGCCRRSRAPQQETRT